MIPRKKEDKSRFLMAPMPGLLVSILVKENQLIEENQPLSDNRSYENGKYYKVRKNAKIKKINCSEGDSLEVDQIILEFE